MMDMGDMPGGMAAVLPVDTASHADQIPQKTAEKTEAPGTLTSEEKSTLLHVLPTMDRVVHLDLKGAAPKVSYFEELFPLFKTLGATGLLIGMFLSVSDEFSLDRLQFSSLHNTCAMVYTSLVRNSCIHKWDCGFDLYWVWVC